MRPPLWEERLQRLVKERTYDMTDNGPVYRLMTLIEVARIAVTIGFNDGIELMEAEHERIMEGCECGATDRNGEKPWETYQRARYSKRQAREHDDE